MKQTIVGVGIDIEKTNRFRMKKAGSLTKKIFTGQEIEYCFGKRYPHTSLSATYAAKEAAYKALAGLGKKQGRIKIKDVEIVRGKSGNPKIVIHGALARGINLHLSMAHDEERAVACVIATREG